MELRLHYQFLNESLLDVEADRINFPTSSDSELL